MSSLQLWLTIAGGLVLVAVVAHGAWTSRKNAPLQPVPEGPSALSGSGNPLASTGLDGPVDPALVLTDVEFAVPNFSIPPVERKPLLDALIDVVAPIALDSLLTGDALLMAMPATRRVGSKPFAIEGLNATSHQWETPHAGQRYSALQAGVQLANRSGALNDIEYSEFVIKTQAFADTVNGTPEVPEMRDEVARARELDHFASAHDAQLSFTVRARNAAWSPGYVQQHAGRLGFVAGVMPGRMVLPTVTAGVPPILGLSFDTQAALAEDPAQSALREVVLSLDVPQVDRA